MFKIGFREKIQFKVMRDFYETKVIEMGFCSPKEKLKMP